MWLLFVEAMQAYVANSRDMFDLPRKLNIAFDNGGSISAVADTNDIGFLAVRVVEGRSIPAGIYFGTARRYYRTSSVRLRLRPSPSSGGNSRGCCCNGSRLRSVWRWTDGRKARLKYLLDSWGVERFLKKTEKLLAFPLIRVPISECEPRHAINRAAHIGVHRQSQQGLHYIGVAVPVGRLPSSQMRALAAIADEFGTGELGLTVWQNLIIPNVSSEHLEAAKQTIRGSGLDYQLTTVRNGTVACTGSAGCRFAATDTKSHALQLATDTSMRDFRSSINRLIST